MFNIHVICSVEHMRDIFDKLGIKYMDGFDENNVTDEYCHELLKRIRADDRIDVLNAGRIYSQIEDENAHFTVKEWIISRIEFIENEIDKLLKYHSLM